MLEPCTRRRVAKDQLELSDGLIRDADHLMAVVLRVVAWLYQEGTLGRGLRDLAAPLTRRVVARGVRAAGRSNANPTRSEIHGGFRRRRAELLPL